ncbi:hypothetical protein L207DRAFT_593113 [Hyaloscypha variabilis F]|uniref:Leucine-rich repeat domain-containing protein n=1 Tax=Hyaloscypha variabilis (strain UAMH 11265 / GT02V1 / F) TaxID=1149755 RepID=A0A2J6QU56_HYAVF|nr:hypothetical protein L207DRAFT_593113 [Hyaloscypha variabilis F]
MAMNALPYEILSKIFTYVADDDQDFQDPKQTLSSVSRTSCRLHHAAQPILYSNFEESNRRTLLKYLGTILDCPHLAANVKTYHGWHKPWTFTKYSANVAFSAWKTNNPGLANIIREITASGDEAQDWFKEMEEGSWDAMTALALAHLPNLQQLHLTIIGIHIHHPYRITRADYEVGNYYWIRETLMRAAQLQHQGISSPLALEHLTTLTIHPNRDNCRELSMSQLLPLLRIKSLKKLFARGWDLEWGQIETAKLTIVELELLNFTVKEEFFVPFFECFPALEKLRYKHPRMEGKHRGLLRTVSLANALIQTRPPLRELYIENGSVEHRWFNVSSIGLIKSFRGFESLEILELLAFDQWVFWGIGEISKSDFRPLAELLPRKIKRLALRGASPWTCGHAMELLKQKDKFPNLEALTIDFAHEVLVEEDGAELSLLRETSARSGVVLVVQGGSYSNPYDEECADIEFDL